MKRLDEGKVSWVDFLRSIKFNRDRKPAHGDANSTQFAEFNCRARAQHKLKEECYLVRSAN